MVGKSHLSIAIGIKALVKGYRVLFTKVSEKIIQNVCVNLKLGHISFENCTTPK